MNIGERTLSLVYDWLDEHVSTEQADLVEAPALGREFRHAAVSFGADPYSAEFRASMLTVISVLVEALSQEEKHMNDKMVRATLSTTITTLSIAAFWEGYMASRHPRSAKEDS